MRTIAGVMILTALLILSGCSVADVETDQLMIRLGLKKSKEEHER